MAYDPMVHPGPRLPAVGAEQTAVRIYEVAPRDGLQNEERSLSPEVRAELCDRLAAAGLPRVEAASFVNPKKVPQMADDEEVLRELGAPPPGVHFIGLVLNHKGFARAAAAGVLAIDSPYTFADDAGAEADMQFARSIGYQAKGVVNPAHVAVANRYLTPSAEDAALARRQVDAFEAARSAGSVRAEVDGLVVEVPSYLQAQRLLERYRQLQARQALRR